MASHTLIESWRTAAGLSRQQLADVIPCHVSAVRLWERGTPAPSAETVGAIGRACGVPDLQRLEAVATAAGEGEGWARLRAVLGVPGAGYGVEVRHSTTQLRVFDPAVGVELDSDGRPVYRVVPGLGEGR